MNNNRCLYCNEIIPEGRMVCPLCERMQMKMGIILQSLNLPEEEVKAVYDTMEENNDD
jgi:hypothetical protein